MNLWRLDPLRPIARRDGVLSIGALATYTDIIRSPLVRKHLPMLAAAARRSAACRFRTAARSAAMSRMRRPPGDTLPVLAAADAVVVLASAGGTRRVPFAEYYTGYRRTVSRPDELIVALEIAPIRGRQWFRKVGTRPAQAISKVVMAGVAGDEPRLALGSVAPTVIRARRTEAALAGARPSGTRRTCSVMRLRR